MLSQVTILGVPLDSVTAEDALMRLCTFAKSTAQHHVMTPNPEMIVEAQRNTAFMEVLQKTALNLSDGAGLLLMARIQGKRLIERVTGIDIVMKLCEQKNIGSVFFLGSAPGIAEKASAILKARNPDLSVAGCFSGSPAETDTQEIIDRVNRSKATILLVAFGAPSQDLWIDRYLHQMPTVRLAMGIGGTFDFIAGERSRAPKWMQCVGIEWLWRLIQEPKRLPRIVRAVIVFPFLVLTRKHQ